MEDFADHSEEAVSGSPIIVETAGEARYFRLVFPETGKGSDISVFEWLVE